MSRKLRQTWSASQALILNKPHKQILPFALGHPHKGKHVQVNPGGDTAPRATALLQPEEIFTPSLKAHQDFSFSLQPTLHGRRGQGREAEVAATAPQALCAPPRRSQVSGDHYQSQVTLGLSLTTLQAPDIVHSLQASSLLRGSPAFRTPLQVCQGCRDTEGVVEDITNSP